MMGKLLLIAAIIALVELFLMALLIFALTNAFRQAPSDFNPQAF